MIIRHKNKNNGLILLFTTAAFLIGTSKAFYNGNLSPRCNHYSPRQRLLFAQPDAWLDDPEESEDPLSDSDAISGPINQNIWQISRPLYIEGNSLKTWAFPSVTKRVQVSIQSPNGRPIEGSVEMWQSPTYTPTQFAVECEDGGDSVVHSILELPANSPATVAVYNTEGPEYPMQVSVAESRQISASKWFLSAPTSSYMRDYVEGGGAVKTYTFGPGVESVEVLLQTNHRNMKAFIEILQGPNDDDEIIEVDANNANAHPFYTVIQTPGGANLLRIVNQHSIEFPFEAFVRPFESVSDGVMAEFSHGGPHF